MIPIFLLSILTSGIFLDCAFIFSPYVHEAMYLHCQCCYVFSDISMMVMMVMV